MCKSRRARQAPAELALVHSLCRRSERKTAIVASLRKGLGALEGEQPLVLGRARAQRVGWEITFTDERMVVG